MKITSQKGFSLLEITLVLGVGTAMAFMKFQDMKKDQEYVIANAVGSQMKQIGEPLTAISAFAMTSFQHCHQVIVRPAIRVQERVHPVVVKLRIRR